MIVATTHRFRVIGMTFLFLMVTGMFALLFTGCSKTELAGSATETTNGKVSGITHNPNDNPQPGILINLYPDDYDPLGRVALPNEWSTETAEDGSYLLEKVTAGTYNIEMQDLENGDRQLIWGVEVTAQQDENEETIDVGTQLLQSPSSLTIYLNEIEGSSEEYFYIPGTSIFLILDSTSLENGYVTFEEIPSSVYNAVNYAANDPSEDLNMLNETIVIEPEEMVIAGPYNSWSDTLKITLNTSGAGVSDELYGFPMLLRLDGSDVAVQNIFNTSQSDGADLRFSKSDGLSPVAYEIESWDAAAGTAIIWVLLDTVLASNSSQFVYLYSGNSSVDSKSSSNDVFNSDNDFDIVFHLNQNPALEGYGSTDGGMGPESVLPGHIDKGINFNANQLIIPPNPDPGILHDATTEFTMSSWASIDSSGGKYQVLFEVGGNARGMLIGYNTQSSEVVFNTVQDSNRVEVVSESLFPQDYPEFIYICATYKDGQMNLYINGTSEADSSNSTMISYHGDGPGIGNTGDFSNATQVNGVAWFGVIDELRYSNKARSAAWIKLNYENQKTASNIITITEN